jgi:hypothetical protein
MPVSVRADLVARSPSLATIHTIPDVGFVRPKCFDTVMAPTPTEQPPSIITASR